MTDKLPNPGDLLSTEDTLLLIMAKTGASREQAELLLAKFVADGMPSYDKDPITDQVTRRPRRGLN